MTWLVLAYKCTSTEFRVQSKEAQVSVDFRSSVSSSQHLGFWIRLRIRIGIFTFFSIFFSYFFLFYFIFRLFFFTTRLNSSLSNDRQTNRPADPQTAATAPHILSHESPLNVRTNREGAQRNKRFMASHSPIVQKRFVACRSYWHTQATTRTKLFLVT